MRLAHQIHFGSQCATESVYWHLPAKVKLKKSHFGKPPLTECVLRPPPCQSELAEASTTFCGTHEFPSKTKATGRPSARAKMPDSPASRQYTPRAMPSSATMEGTISARKEGSVRGVSFAASANKVPCCKVVKFGQSDNWSDISASSAPKIAK